jgi:hypothetical protein
VAAAAAVAVSIHSIERRLRGGTQALLVRDSSGDAYVAKFVGNPQGTRTLVNEWIVTRLLKHLRVSTPEVQPVEVNRGVPGEDLLEFQVGNRKIPIQEGVHLGSRCPVDPQRKAIFDFLPRTFLDRIVNLPDLLLAYVFDRWVGQCDSRQAIFVRERGSGPKPSFRAYLIDHGQSFGGSRWEFSDTALAGLFHDRSIYADPDFEAISHSSVEKIQALPGDVLFSVEQEIPREWLPAGDRETLMRLLEVLSQRRFKLHDTVDRALHELRAVGIAIPRTTRNRCLLGLILLLGSFSTSISIRGDATEPTGCNKGLKRREFGGPGHHAVFQIQMRSTEKDSCAPAFTATRETRAIPPFPPQRVNSISGKQMHQRQATGS